MIYFAEPTEVRPLRKKILRPDLTLEELHYPGDEEKDSRHIVFKKDEEIKAIASIYRMKTDKIKTDLPMFRLRGMAVDEDMQGTGVGKKILENCFEYIAASGGGLLWCDARLHATGFYENLGFVKHGDIYQVPNVGPHYLMSIEIHYK